MEECTKKCMKMMKKMTINEIKEKRVKNIDVKEHVDALVEGESDLSEEFKTKAATVFEVLQSSLKFVTKLKD